VQLHLVRGSGGGNKKARLVYACLLSSAYVVRRCKSNKRQFDGTAETSVWTTLSKARI